MATKRERRRHRRKLLASLAILCLVAGYIWLALSQPLLTLQPKVALTVPTQRVALSTLNWPDYGESAVGAAGYGVLATHGSQKPLPTASLAKVMTAIAVLRQRPLQLNQQGPTITLTQADVDSYNSFVARDGSVVGVALGEQISEYQALQAMLLPSANNMAETLARWAFGSIPSYNAYANSYAKQLGLDSVHITDPSGYDEKTVGSAHDLTLLGSLAMLNPVFAQIVSQPNALIPVVGTITNYNFQLGQNGNVGIKTGNNDGDKGAFLFASKQQVGTRTITVVGTIMGGPDLSTVLQDSGPLTTSALVNFTVKHFVSNGETVGTYEAPYQSTATARASQDLDLVTWNGSNLQATAHLNSLKAPTASGSQVGTVGVSGTNGSDTVPVQLQQSISRPSLTWRLAHPFGR